VTQVLCRRRRCGYFAIRPVYSFGGDVIARLCSSGHVTPMAEKPPPRCKECSCRHGHATGCPFIRDDAWEQATLYAEEGEFEEAAAWLEMLVVQTRFFTYLPDGVKIDG
jgi:hypothetical protein